MAKSKKKTAVLSPEDKLQQALVPVEEQPYKVPENWRWVRLESMKTNANGFFDGDWILSENMDSEGEVRLLQLSDIGVGVFLDKSNKHISERTFNELGCTPLHEGDVMISRMAEPIARSCIVPSFPYTVITAVDIAVLRCNHHLVLNRYLNYLCNAKWFTDTAFSLARGTTRVRITRKNLGGIPFPLPPLPEQQRIVDRIESLFAKLDEAKEKAQAVVDGFEDRKAAILHKAFTGELTAKWRQEHGIELNSWDTKRLSETTIRIIDGDRGKNYPKKHEFSPDGYCIFLSARNVTIDGFVFDKYECISKEKDELLHNGRLERGDMVMTTRGTIGNVAIYDYSVPFEHLRINSGMVIYRGGNEFNKQYLFWLYKSKLIINQIDKLRTGTAQPQLPIKVMNALILPIPSIDEQIVIVSMLNKVIMKEQQAKEAAEQVIDQIDLMKKSILARAFRGELGTNDPNDESAVELLKSVL